MSRKVSEEYDREIPQSHTSPWNHKVENRTEQMVYLKIPVGNNAHEDIQHNIIYNHGRR